MSKNAVIYARYSSANQREESIEGQLRECKNYAKKNDLVIIGEYIDRAMTGKNDNRPDFQRLIRDSAKLRFEYVIAYKTDRIARNRYDAATYKARLKKNNVKVTYACETIPDGPEGIILESVLEGCAEYYSANLAQNTKRGLKENALNARYNGGGRAFGYNIENKHYVINNSEAPWVKRIFDQYISGVPSMRILDDLDKNSVRSKDGKKMNYNHLRSVLTNIKYTGTYKYDDVLVEGAIPAIISNQDFETVQAKIESKQAHSRKRVHEGGYDFLLTTKIFCGKCGSTMCGDSGTSSAGSTHAYYSCLQKKNKRKCDSKSIRKDVIEELVTGATVNYLLLDEIIDEVSDLIIEYQEKNQIMDTVNALRQREKEIGKAISNLLSALEQGIVSDSLQFRLSQLEADKRAVAKEINKELLSIVHLKKEEIVYWMNQFKGMDSTDYAYCMNLVDTFINSVYVFEDDIVITYNFSGNKNKVTLQRVKDNLAAIGSPDSSDYHVLAPQVRLELTTLRLTAACSTN